MDKRSVLVVEDDWILRQALVDALNAEGWIVHEAESGETALEIVRGGVPIDCLITDIRLGGKLDGWDVAEAFRANDAFAPIIYLTGNPALESRQVVKSVFLSKPYQLQRLLAMCHRLFSDA
jgi:CheY-like chemotaxis protein